MFRVEEKDGNLVITLPMRKEPKLTETKKSFTVATTGGNMETDLEINGQTLKVGVNAFYKNPDYVKPIG